MSEKVSNDLDYDIPVFRSFGMKIPDIPIEYEYNNNNSNLKDIDITALYQKEPFKSENPISFSKTSFTLIILVFIILIITFYQYKSLF